MDQRFLHPSHPEHRSLAACMTGLFTMLLKWYWSLMSRCLECPKKEQWISKRSSSACYFPALPSHYSNPIKKVQYDYIDS